MANGLVTLQTDLKSLTFTSIPPGGKVPYVVKDIGDNAANQLGGGGGTLLSGLLAGGLGTEIGRRIDDTTRIAKMLIDRPGVKFLLNQALLQQTGLSQKLQESRDQGSSRVGAIIKQVATTAFNTAKIGVSILAQVPVAGTGTHFVSGFRTDTYLRKSNNSLVGEEIPTPGEVPSTESSDGRVLGSPLALNKQPIEGEVDSNFYDKDTGSQIPGLTSLDLSNPLNKYISTDLSLEDPRFDLIQKDPNDPTVLIVKDLTYVGTKRRYVAEYIKQTDEGFEERTQNFGDVTKENRLKLGAQGGSQKQQAKENNTYWFMSDEISPNKSSEVDFINQLGPINPEAERRTQTTGSAQEAENKDIIKFKFNILTPERENILFFRAYLDAFNDSYTGQWNPIKYLGRAEDFQVYGGFQRKISLSFKIAAATRVEMQPLYQKMLWLASSTAPTYAAGGQFMRGTIVKMTVGDYLYELPGVLNSIQYAWEQDYPWETTLLTTLKTEQGDPDYDNKMQQLPMVMNCQLEFTPIHTFTPTTGLTPYFTRPGTENLNSYLRTDTIEIPKYSTTFKQPGGTRRFETTPSIPEGINTSVFTSRDVNPFIPRDTTDSLFPVGI